MKLCLLDSQRQEFAFPLKGLYDTTVRLSQQAAFRHAIPYIKKHGLTVISMDYRTERALEEEGIPFISLKHLTENLWDYERGVRAMDEVKALCGLHDVSDRIIAHLSRGYHQRVGLADALIAGHALAAMK